MTNITAQCGECGADLTRERLGVEHQPNDNLVCPVHGVVCTFDEFRQMSERKAKDMVTDELRRILRKSGPT